MCLAKAYIQADGGAGDAAVAPLMENVTQVDVEGEEISLRTLFGENRVVRGRIASMDFAEGKLMLVGVEA